jgi:hypothetical protein
MREFKMLIEGRPPAARNGSRFESTCPADNYHIEGKKVQILRMIAAVAV